MSRWISILKSRPNLSDRERLFSGLAGTALLLRSLREPAAHGWFLALFGTALYVRGFTGNSRLYHLLGYSKPPEGEEGAFGRGKRPGVRIERTLRVNRPVAEVFRTWRNFENLPHFMTHLERVEVTSRHGSRWVAKAPAGLHVSWNAEVTEERPDELIAWRSMPGSEVDNAGRVTFRALEGATEISLFLEYDAPGGRPGAAVARLFHEEPWRQIDADLLRFKHMMEVAG